MAINPETQYPGKIAPSSPNYPYGAARNITTPGDGTGTPWEAALVNDLFGFQQAILSEAGVVPSGSPDRVGASQYLEALSKIYAKVFDTFSDMLNSTELAEGQNVLVLGRFSKGDNGGNVYEIVAPGTGTVDGGSYIDLVGSTGQAKGLFPYGVITVLQFGATGDGVTDDAQEIQQALNHASSTGAILDLAGKTYISNTTLTIDSNTNIIGPGTIKAGSSLPDGDSLAESAVMSGTIDVYDQSDISIYGVEFDGSDRALTTPVALVRLFKVDRLRIRNCTFKNHRYILLSHGGSRDVDITYNEFTSWGVQSASPAEGGSAIWCSNNPIDNTKGGGYLIQGNSFHDSEWCGIYALASEMRITGNSFRDIKEAAIYSRFTNSGTNGRRHVIENNIVDGVTMKSIQAAGFEIGGQDSVVRGNIIINCEASGIDCTDPTYGAIITDNIVRDCVTDQVNFPAYGQISLRTTSAAGLMQDILVSNNTVKGTVAMYGIRAWTISGSDSPPRIRIIDNDAASSGVTANVSFELPVSGGGCVISGNVGHESFTPVTGRTTLAAATGNQSITGVGFQPRRVSIEAVKSSATENIRSSGSRDRNTSGSFCAFSHSSGSGNRGGSVAPAIINLVDSAGTGTFVATLSSFDLDGFTINKSVAGHDAEIIWTAYP